MVTCYRTRLGLYFIQDFRVVKARVLLQRNDGFICCSLYFSLLSDRTACYVVIRWTAASGFFPTKLFSLPPWLAALSPRTKQIRGLFEDLDCAKSVESCFGLEVKLKMTVFWDVAPYSLVEIDRRFRGTYASITYRPLHESRKHL
jgi:hypothetical protein